MDTAAGWHTGTLMVISKINETSMLYEVSQLVICTTMDGIDPMATLDGTLSRMDEDGG